jgi:ATP-binding cassette, subfamily B (MDR/TAP), member 1
VPYKKLLSKATGAEKCRIFSGWVFAFLSGVGAPLFAFFIGDAINEFKPDAEAMEVRSEIRIIFFFILAIGVIVWIFSFLYWMCVLTFANSVAMRTKQAYLKAILRQEAAWFDLVNYMELGARMEKETLAINKALGEKFGEYIKSIGTLISGLCVGFAKGWSLALCILIIGPFMAVAGGLMQWVVK